MTWCSASVSCKIPGISWDKHQQTSFPMKNVLFISHKHEISTGVHCDLSLLTNTQHQTDLVQIAGRLATRTSGSYAQQDSSCVEWASRLLPMPFSLKLTIYSSRLQCHYVILFLRTSHFVSLSSSLHFHSSKSWLYKHLSKFSMEQNRAERQALLPICDSLRPNYNADTT